MCLSKVDKVTKHKRRRIGYKVMHLKQDGTLHSEYRQCSLARKVGKLYTDRSRGSLFASLDSGYPKGYHIYLNKQDAVSAKLYAFLRVVKIQFSNVVASGMQMHKPVVVARKMTILEIL